MSVPKPKTASPVAVRPPLVAAVAKRVSRRRSISAATSTNYRPPTLRWSTRTPTASKKSATIEYNLSLSEKRAQAVKRRLGALGIPENNMSTVPRGELDASGSEESGWEKDRRVEVNFR
jgi:hypothetical protein